MHVAGALASVLVFTFASSATCARPAAAAEQDVLAVDKAAHAAVSYSLTLTGALLLEKLELPRWQAVLIAAGGTFLLGLGKEVVLDDEVSGGDLAADGIGVGLAAGLVLTFEL